jgi:LssY C-terminus
MIITWVERWLTAICALSLLLVLFNCSKAPPDPSGKDQFVSRAVRQQQGPVSVRASVLGDDESQSYFGAGLADQGIQAVWLSVENDSDAILYYLPVTTDPNYFSPPEAAQLLHVWWSGDANAAIDTVLARDAMPDIIPPHQTAAGFVFTHREGGLKFLNASFVESRQQFDFRFVLPLGGRTYAVQKVDFSGLYPPGAIEAVDLAGLRARLETLPCCAVSKVDSRSGDPLNIVVVGNGADAIFPFITRGWRLDEPFDLHSTYRTVRAFLFGTEYLTAPVSPLYVFGRTQDVSFQKARDKISLRNHLRLWLAPFTIDGQYVWVGQISRDIGIKLTTESWYLTTHRISPEVDQDRYYLLQDLIMTGEVSRFGFGRGVGASTPANPRTNLTGDPYVTDGLRLVVFLGAQRRPFNEIEFLEWERSPP